MADFSELKGKTCAAVEVDEKTDQITFTTEGGEKYRLHHRQDCCESVVIEDVNGDVNDLIGTPILSAVEAVTQGDSRYGTETHTFYHIRTKKGDVTIRWHGESNGYYSESVDFIKTK